MLLFQSWVDLFTLHCSSSFRCVNENLTVDSGGYVCLNSPCVVAMALLKEREVNMVCGGTSLLESKTYSILSSSQDWILWNFRTFIFMLP